MNVHRTLGTDGSPNAMWEGREAANLVHKLWNQDPRRMPGNVLAQTWQGNAELAGSFFPDAPLGRLVPGAYADLILVDYHPATPSRRGTRRGVGYGFRESKVTATMVAGQVRMRDRQQGPLMNAPYPKTHTDAQRLGGIDLRGLCRRAEPCSGLSGGI
jgi:cytosine/adenosine deaminase-related metal-dependent hydrolase